MPPPWHRGFIWPVRIVQGELPPLLGWQPVLGGPHEEIHEGHYFRAHWFVDPLANDASIDLLVRTGEYQSHFVMFSACGGDSRLILHEDIEYTLPGAAVDVWNANRQAARIEEGNYTLVYANPTAPVFNGNYLVDRFVPGGSVGASPGSESGIREEWILDPEDVQVKRDYLVRLTNISGVNQPASLEIEWYEFRPF